MKIVAKSNFAIETMSEYFVDDVPDPHDRQKEIAVETMTPKHMQMWCDRTNDDRNTRFYKVVDDDYELYIYEI